jgi:hypothetical protein
MSPSVTRSERGAIIIQVAIMLLALTLFSAFVLDYGVLWTSRREAQNSADAGALAAAINMMNDPDNTSTAVDAAHGLAHANTVWGQAPANFDVLVDLPITCPPGTGGGLGCVRVDVQRGQIDRNGVAHTNVLPTFFANLAGINSQAIMATATAQVTNGNAVPCIKPWIVADKWIDGDEAPVGGWTQTDTYNPPVDTYSAPGFQYPADAGTELALHQGSVGTWTAGWTQEIDFGCSGSNCYRDNIEGCPDWVPVVALYDGTYKCDSKGDTPDPKKGCIDVKTGMSAGPTAAGVNYLVGLDPDASWDPNGGIDHLGGVTGGCMSASPPNCTGTGDPTLSPRVVPIAVFNTAVYYNESASCSGTGCVAQVVNILGFFIEGMCFDVYGASAPPYCGTTSESKKTVLGRILRVPGTAVNTGGTTTSSFALTTRLVR